jgi:filamentous hemagglutinin family protein
MPDFSAGSDSVFQRALRVLVATLVPLTASAIYAPANAAPSGGQVAAGQATVSSQGNTTRVTQSSTRAVVNWQGFNVAAGESVVFVQPSAGSITLNRVSGGSASDISGSLSANGRVFIVNPSGVVFGSTARVNTAGLVATTADIGNTNFMQGRYEFHAPGPDGSQIANHGVITVTDGGRVALLGPSVENTGTISANRGVVVLASGQVFLVDLFGDGLVQVAAARVSAPYFGDTVTNVGNLQVGAGTVLVRSRLQPVQGNINSTSIANLASSTVVLPGGTIAFVGDVAGGVQSAAPTWLVAVGPQFQGAGVIDATPTYSFQPVAALPSGSSSIGGPADNAAAVDLAQTTSVGWQNSIAFRKPSAIPMSPVLSPANARCIPWPRVGGRRMCSP